VHHPEVPPITRPRQRALELAHQPDAAQRRHPVADPERDVAREAPREVRPRAMEHSRVRTRRTPCPLAPPAPARWLAEREGELSFRHSHCSV
jgi:hypothetical protein